MKKVNLFGVAVIGLAIMFSSCAKKVETSSMKLDLTKSATIKVTFLAELDHSSHGLELVPNETPVLIRIANSSFNSAATGYWTTTEAINSGSIEVQVPVTDLGVDVEILPIEFLYDQVQPYGSVSSTIKTKFRVPAFESELSVKPGEIRTREVTYTDLGAMDNFVETVSRKFNLKCETDATESKWDFIATGTKVTFFTNGWMTNVTASNYGAVDVALPNNEEVYIRFEGMKRVYDSNGDRVTLKYRYDAVAGTYTETSPVRQTLNCGSGQVWE
jgi:hypothetical protein